MAREQGKGLSGKEQAGVVQLGKMLAGGEDQSGHLDDFDQEAQKELDKIHEAQYGKMHAAMLGGGEEELGPSEFEEQQAKQTQALGQEQTMQSAAEAAQAQGAQMPVPAPVEAPGPQGESTPYPAQAQQKQPPGPNQGPPGPGEEL